MVSAWSCSKRSSKHSQEWRGGALSWRQKGRGARLLS